MKKLTTDERDQLEKAIESISDYCAEGLSPNAAIVKTAKAMKLTPDRLPILVNAYNAGATAEHWSSSDSIRDKVASFPIADIDQIRASLYPGKVKKASASPVKSDGAFSRSAKSIFGDDPFECYSAQLPAMQKSASKKSMSVRREEADKMKKKSEIMLKDAKAQVATAFSELAFEVGRRDVPSFDVLVKTAGAVYGDKAVRVMKCLADEYPKVKQAKSYQNAPLRANHPFFQALEKTFDCVDQCAQAMNMTQTVLKKSAALSAEVDNEWRTELYGDEMKRTLLTPRQRKEAEVKKK